MNNTDFSWPADPLFLAGMAAALSGDPATNCPRTPPGGERNLWFEGWAWACEKVGTVRRKQRAFDWLAARSVRRLSGFHGSDGKRMVRAEDGEGVISEWFPTALEAVEDAMKKGGAAL